MLQSKKISLGFVLSVLSLSVSFSSAVGASVAFGPTQLRMANAEALTLEVWIKATETTEEVERILCLSHNDNKLFELISEHLSGLWYRTGIHVYGNDTVWKRYARHDWTYLAVTIEKNEYRFYLNGNLTGYGLLPEESAADYFSNISVDILADASGFSGQIAHPRIHNEGWSQARIEQQFNATAEAFGLELKRTRPRIKDEIIRGFHQAVRNPYFTRWTDGKPAFWDIDDNIVVSSEISETSRRSGLDKGQLVLQNPIPGKGIHQNVKVRRGDLYLLSIWLSVEGQGNAIVMLTDQNDNFYSARRIKPGQRVQNHVIDVRPESSEITLSVIRDPEDTNSECLISIESSVVATVQSMMPVAAKPRINRPVRFMYGWRDSHEKRWHEALDVFNVIAGRFENVSVIKRMTTDGILPAQAVQIYYTPNNFLDENLQPLPDDRFWRITRDRIVAQWAAPFVDTFDGQMNEGMPAMVWDEFTGHPDLTYLSQVHIDAMEELRMRFPNKLIFVFDSGRSPVAWPTPEARDEFDDYEKAMENALAVHRILKGDDFTEQDLMNLTAGSCWRSVRAINRYADLFLSETYVFESDADKVDFPRLAMRSLDSIAPGILKKTIPVLGITTTPSWMYADSPYILFNDFLEEQIHRIVNDPIASNSVGVGYWAFYRADQPVVNHLCAITRHYFMDANTDYFGTGHYQNPVSDPGFEVWRFNENDRDTARIIQYNEDTAPKKLHDRDRTLSLKENVLRLSRSDAISQSLYLSKGVHRLSAWFWSEKPGAVLLRVQDMDKGHIAENICNLGASRWARHSLVFEVAQSDQQVKFTIENHPSNPALPCVYIDNVEIEPVYGINQFPEVLRVTVNRTETGAILKIAGKNLTPAMECRVDGLNKEVVCDWLSSEHIECDYASWPDDYEPGSLTLKSGGDYVYVPWYEIEVDAQKIEVMP